MLVSALLVKNEAERYLERVLKRCLEFSDSVLLLDDRSTDDSAKVAKDLGCKVKGRSILAGDAWGKETPARAELWQWAAEEAGDGWVLVCDADMLLHGDPRPLVESEDVTCWAWPLFDLWNDEQHARVDGPWALGPLHARPWLFRPSACPQPLWGGRGIHSGHCPANFAGPCGLAPSEVYWLHLGYCQKEHRLAKHAQYAAVEAQLTDFEKAHAASIADD